VECVVPRSFRLKDVFALLIEWPLEDTISADILAPEIASPPADLSTPPFVVFESCATVSVVVMVVVVVMDILVVAVVVVVVVGTIVVVVLVTTVVVDDMKVVVVVEWHGYVTRALLVSIATQGVVVTADHGDETLPEARAKSS
jgi:hypothetical protein